MPPEQNNDEIKVSVPLSQVIRATIAECVPPAIQKAMADHTKNCSIGDVKKVVFGNGKTGIKTHVHENTQDINDIKQTYLKAKNKIW